MSRIYFHTPTDDQAEVYGSERAYMGTFAANVALAVIHPWHQDREWLQSVTDGPSYIWGNEDRWLESWKTWFKVAWEDGGLSVQGEQIGCMDLALNTLIATRSASLDLMARLHGTCEDYAWCAPENLPWLAETIRQGRAENVLRPEQGWESVADLCDRMAEAGECVVTSYSVTDQFPNRYVIGDPWFYPWTKGPDGELLPNEPDADAEERWYALSDRERWDLALPAIKAREYNRELRPNDPHGFMSGASAFDLMAEKWTAKVEA